MVRSGACKWHLLTDDVGHAGIEILLDLFSREVSAVTVITSALGSVLLESFEALLGAEASVSFAFFYELLGIGLIHREPLALDIRAVFAADIRTFIVIKARKLHCVIDYLSSTFYIALTVGIFDPEHKSTVFVPCSEILIKRGAKIAYMHKARGAGCESRAYFHT
jgi:hypothetical protein